MREIRNPTCNRAECFGCQEGECLVLIENNFGQKGCPFFKTKEQVESEKEYCRERLNEIRGIK